jgi:carboxyl-terminal processing protease
MSHRIRAALGIILLLSALWATADPSPTFAAGEDGSLIVAALGVLDQNYYRSVDDIALLNAAIAYLRQASHLSTDALPDIPAGTMRIQAVASFRAEFVKAAQAAGGNPSVLAADTLRTMLESLKDTHVSYVDAAEMKQMQQEDKGAAYSGVGIIIAVLKTAAGENEVFVEEVFEGGPAAAAGIHRFDRIVQIDGAVLPPSVTPEDVSDHVRGPAGSKVALTVQRGDQTLTITVTRGVVKIQLVTGSIIQPGVAYIHVRSFEEGAGDQVRRTLAALKAKGPLRGVILDLRGNPGGLLGEGELAAGVFLPGDTLIGKLIDRTGETDVLADGSPVVPVTTPLVVLTDGGTASTAEVLTEGLHDAHRATLVGGTTAGALGAAQFVKLPVGEMEVTVSQVVGPHFEQIEGVGITPDRPVALTLADVEKGVDSQLDAALKTILGWVPSGSIVAA